MEMERMEKKVYSNGEFHVNVHIYIGDLVKPETTPLWRKLLPFPLYVYARVEVCNFFGHSQWQRLVFSNGSFSGASWFALRRLTSEQRDEMLRNAIVEAIALADKMKRQYFLNKKAAEEIFSDAQNYLSAFQEIGLIESGTHQ